MCFFLNLRQRRTYAEHLQFIIPKNDPPQRQACNECVLLVQRFRTAHLEYACRYSHKQSLQSAANPRETGTGGTPFMTYLRKHKEETAKYLLPP